MTDTGREGEALSGERNGGKRPPKIRGNFPEGAGGGGYFPSSVTGALAQATPKRSIIGWAMNRGDCVFGMDRRTREPNRLQRIQGAAAP